MEPISIACTTCQTRLRVRDEEALGKILACPRCGAMVQVPAPALETPAESGAMPTVAGVVSSTPDDSGLDLTLSPEEQRFGRWIWLSLAAGGALVLAIVGWAFIPRGEAVPDLANAAEQMAVAPPADAAPPEHGEAAASDAAAAEEADQSGDAGGEASPVVDEQPSDTRALDDANHQRTIEGLSKFAAEDGAFPVGAAGAVQLPPVERLSWIATLLPYYDHQDWHDALNFRRSWRDARNRDVTTQTLAGVVNPAISSEPAQGANAEFPPTHYVGVAGVGADAGDLPVDHPRAGVFGFNRRVRSEDIVDGTSQTIAVLGASGSLGPWSAGGPATVRPLTQAPYVNGPDGFGSGTPDGVAAGMADGSVRFFSREVDPRVLEQMSTIAGHEAAPPELRLAGPPQAAVVPSVDPQPAGDEVVAGDAETPDAEMPDASAPVSEEAQRQAAEARLGDRLLEIDFAEVPLADFIDFVSQLSTLEITLDLEALAEVGVTPDLKLSIRQTDTTVGEALTAGLAELGLAYSVRGGQLVVSSPRRLDGELREVRYRVGDLTGGDRAALEKVADIVQSLVEPATWVEQGGSGTLELVENSLLVRQSDAAHYELLVLCEKLRVARGGAPASGGDPTRFELTSRSEKARAKLDTPITVNYSAGKPLTKIVAFLQDRGHVNLTIDWLALGQTGATREVDAVLAVENVPLGDALDRLLAPLELDYVVMGPRTIQVTTRAAAAARRELEFYPVRDLLDEGTSPEAIIARLTDGLVPAAAPGEVAPAVVARYDAPAACILLLAPQGAQREAEQRLAAWRAERAESKSPPAAGAASAGLNEP